jgi:hypothetical protein
VCDAVHLAIIGQLRVGDSRSGHPPTIFATDKIYSRRPAMHLSHGHQRSTSRKFVWQYYWRSDRT